MAYQRYEDFGSGLAFVEARFRLDDPVREPQARVIADEREEARIGRRIGKQKPAVERQRAIGEAPFAGDLVHIERPPADLPARATKDRKSVVEGQGGSVRVDLGGCRFLKKKKKK